MYSGYQYLTKRIAALLLVVVVFLSVACSGQNAGASQTTTEPTSIPVFRARETYKVSSAYGGQLADFMETDFCAKWIWEAKNTKQCYTAFRKVFELTDVPAEARAYIAAESKYWLWVNGELAVYDGGLKRGMTTDSFYYDLVDLAPYLKAGENTLAFLVAVNGRSGYSSVDSGAGGLFFELHAGDQTVTSDASFKYQRLSAYQDGIEQTYSVGALAERGVNYDANLAIDDWQLPGFDDSGWQNAREIASVGESPYGALVARPVPMPLFDKTYTDFENSADYIGVPFTEKTVIELKLPRNLQVSLYFELISESETAQLHYYGKWANKTFSNTDYYTAKKGEQSFESLPWRSGESVIIEVPAGITFRRLAYRLTEYDTGYGSFTCSDNALNQLWTRAKNTLAVCMRDTFMDCPDRERGSYAGDSVNQMQIAAYAASPDALLLMKKLYLTELGFTGDDHVLSTAVPGQYDAGEIVVQCLALIASMREYYLYTGDADTLRRFYPAAVNYLKLFQADPDGLPEYRKTKFDWEDWGEEPMDTVPAQAAWYYYALRVTHEIADALNITGDEAFLSEREASARNAFRAKYWNGTAFASSEFAGKADERVQAIAVLSGLADSEQYETIAGILSDESKYACSPYMELYCEKALCEMGFYEEARDRMIKRYDQMLRDPETTTLWEEFFEPESLQTRNHAWSGGSLVAMSGYFAGIRPTSEGYATYTVCPQPMFDDMNATVHTVKGDISVSIHKSDIGYDISVTGTSNAHGTLKLSKSFGKTISGATAESEDDNNFWFEIGNGLSLHIG